MLFATAFFLLASCAKDVATVAKQDVEPATSGEQRAVEAFNRFVSHLNSDPKTRSAAAVAAPRVVGIRKANTLDYIDGAARTRSAGNGAGVYELELLNPDTTVGYAVVGDEELANEVFAYSPVGSIADTTYNEGLALYFRELALLTAAQEPKTRDNWSIGDGGWGRIPTSCSEMSIGRMVTVLGRIFMRMSAARNMSSRRRHRRSLWMINGPDTSMTQFICGIFIAHMFQQSGIRLSHIINMSTDLCLAPL